MKTKLNLDQSTTSKQAFLSELFSLTLEGLEMKLPV